MKLIEPCALLCKFIVINIEYIMLFHINFIIVHTGLHIAIQVGVFPFFFTLLVL